MNLLYRDVCISIYFSFFEQNTAYEMRISDWSSDVCSSDLVSRRLPDTLAIRVVEREPMALWQNQGVVHLVDANGVALQPVDSQNWPDLPLIVGDRKSAV